MWRIVAATTLVVTAVACARPTPAPIPVLSATPVHASFARTWSAVIDILSERNIPVKTMDRSSGFVAAEMSGVPAGTIGAFTLGCGGFWDTIANGGKATEGVARYNIRVIGDSTESTVKVTARFTEFVGGTAKDCASKGTFEIPFQNAVKERAESE